MKCICQALAHRVRYLRPNSRDGLQRVAIQHVVVEPERLLVETLPRVVVHPIGGVRRPKFRLRCSRRNDVREPTVSFTRSFSSHATAEKGDAGKRYDYTRNPQIRSTVGM